MKKLIVVIFFYISFLYAEEQKEQIDNQKISECISNDIKDEVIIEELKGIIIFSNIKDYEKVKKFHGLKVKNLHLPGPKKELEEKLKQVYLNKLFTKKILQEIKDVIVSFYGKYNHSIVTVLVPEQEITNGVLQLIILEGKVGEIRVINNHYWPTKRILNNIWLRENDTIDTARLLADVAWLNKDPFQNIDVLLQTGKKEGYTDIELIVKDRFPFRPYVGGDNSGTEFTGFNRIFFGFNLGNLFYSNQVLTYQYTAAFDFYKFYAHTLNYTAHLPWRHSIVLYGGYSKNKPNLPGLNSDGESSQVSARYEVPINNIYKNYQHNLIIGGDYKLSNNNLETVENVSQVKISRKAALTQFMLGYQSNVNLKQNIMIFVSEFYISPFDWLKNQTKSAYNALHTYAAPKYVYYKLYFENQYSFYNWTFNFKLRGQLSMKNLLPSEQYYLGGEDTLRGYENRVVSRDNALNINIELKTPPINFFLQKALKIKDQIIFYNFIDFGIAQDYKKITSESNQALLGTGFGLKYFIKNNVSTKFDWGIPVLKINNKHRSQHIYLSVVVSI